MSEIFYCRKHYNYSIVMELLQKLKYKFAEAQNYRHPCYYLIRLEHVF